VIFFVNHKHVSHPEADLQLHTFWMENFPGDEQLRSLSDLALSEEASVVPNGWGSFAETVVCLLRRTKQFGTVEKFYIYIQNAKLSIFDPHVAYPAAT
jgi:hypothetical protein